MWIESGSSADRPLIACVLCFGTSVGAHASSVSAVAQSVLAGNSRQSMHFSFQLQQRLMKYHTQLVHETLEGT